ncbi:MAG: hypothetical protein R3F37_23450 [Candidatus Competibacteraceae bacterium]
MPSAVSAAMEIVASMLADPANASMATMTLIAVQAARNAMKKPMRADPASWL